MLAKAGRVEADIDVAKAVISGSVTGNINAPEGVVLDSDARVTGQIHTRMLSVRVGALFEGDCLFLGPGSIGRRNLRAWNALNNTDSGKPRDSSRESAAWPQAGCKRGRPAALHFHYRARQQLS